MSLVRLEIENFRGIRSLDWRIPASTVCLVGPNDSGKTTILDAIELVLWPRWSASFDDADFFNADTGQQIRIRATVGALPAELTREECFGLRLQGWPPVARTGTTPETAAEPGDDHRDVLVVQLSIDAGLEPKWVVVDARGEETLIGWKDRERLGAVRIGTLLDRHLGWGRGSVLSRLTGELDQVGGQLAEASRAARSIIKVDGLPQFAAAASKAQAAAKLVGVTPLTGYGPRLDVTTVGMTSSGFTLHDGEVPLRRAGEGSRRLLTLAMQREVVAGQAGGVTLVDEVEHGLEPFRLRRVLGVLRQMKPAASQAEGEPPRESPADGGTLILSSHSPITIAELEPVELGVVRRDRGTGNATVREVASSLRDVIRAVPDALLCPKVLLCEGKTEMGFACALDREWAAEKDGASFAFRGVAVVDGGGKELAKRARGLLCLGYRVVCFMDSDDPSVRPDLPGLANDGATVICWADEFSIEARLAQDLPWEAIVGMVMLAAEDREVASLAAAVSARLSSAGTGAARKLGLEPTKWRSECGDERALRLAIAEASQAKNNAWFKRFDKGEKLGALVLRHLRQVESKDLGQKLALLKRAIHGE